LPGTGGLGTSRPIAIALYEASEEMPGENLDLSSDSQGAADSAPPGARRFLGVHFACCGAYARVYVNREGTEYVGRCPRCLAQARFVIGEEGQSGRFFSVS
jgi:hypothetical protein